MLCTLEELTARTGHGSSLPRAIAGGKARRPGGDVGRRPIGPEASTVAATEDRRIVATKKQKARAAAAGKEVPGKDKAKPKKKTSRGK
jgi:hypothetical protein